MLVVSNMNLRIGNIIFQYSMYSNLILDSPILRVNTNNSHPRGPSYLVDLTQSKY